jgi:GxxExxY protein
LTGKILGCAIEVHRHLGPGLLESTYEQCLAYEMRQAGLAFRTQASIPVCYKGIQLDCGYRADLFVEKSLIVELKAIDHLDNIHQAQLLTYMKLTNIRLGLLINFNERLLRHGIKKFVL